MYSPESLICFHMLQKILLIVFGTPTFASITLNFWITCHSEFSLI